MIYKIKVTQEHIDAGKAERCDKCPIALATAEVLKIYGVSVSRYHGKKSELLGKPTLRFLKDENDYDDCTENRLLLPDECGTFMKRFDTHKHVKPFEFELDTEKVLD